MLKYCTDELTTARDAAEKAQNDLKKLEESTENTEAVAIRKKVIQRIKIDRKQEDTASDTKEIPKIETISASAKQPYRTDKLSRCDKKERKLISRIYNIIVDSTDEKTAETIIQKIEEEFK